MAFSLILPSAAAANPSADNKALDDKEPYVDRLIDGGNLVPLATQGNAKGSNSKGPVRSLDIEIGGSIIAPRSTIAGIDSSALDTKQREAGISVAGRYQTVNFGLLGVDAQLRRGSGTGTLGPVRNSDWSGSANLTSRDLPIGHGWAVDTTVGTASTPTIALLHRQARFYLPSMPVLGGSVIFNRYRKFSAASTFTDLEPVASFSIAAGEPGLLGGLRLSDFTGLSGTAVSAGGQINLASGWSSGIQAIAVRNSRDPYAAILGASTAGSADSRITAQGALGTISYVHDGLSMQANAIWSHRRENGSVSAQPDATGSAGGAWVDASLHSGRSHHSAGFYYFGPKLAWGTSALINNAYGGYYRFTKSSQRWRWSFSVDAIDSVNGQRSSGIIVNADVRRKVGFETSVGVNSTMRISNGQRSTQLLGFVDFPSGLGSARTELGWSQDPFSDIFRVGINQNWELPVWLPSGSRLSTQASFEHRRQSSTSPYVVNGTLAEKANSFGLALSAGATPINGLSFDATLAYNSNGSSARAEVYGPIDTTGGVFSSEQGRAFSASIVATARLSSRWSLTASYTDTTSRITSLFGLPSPASGSAALLPLNSADPRRSSFHLRAAYLTLRFSISAGRPTSGLGVRQFPIGGAGNLEGRVFLDANDNRRREPAEKGVGGIVVILDGMQAVRTDPAGYYRFDGVSDGPHRITLNADMLPLPWIIEADDKRRTGEPFAKVVAVGVRSTTVLDIAAGQE
ncbi:MAG: hypothetical protein ACKOUT_08175 [Novosphingobium sp.]